MLASECRPPPFGFLVPSAWGLRDRRGSNPHGNRVIRNLGTRGIVAIEGGASGGRKVLERRGDEKPKRDQPSNEMTREEAERLRALLRGTRAADYQPSGLQRVGAVIAQAKLNSGVNKKD